MLQHTATHCNTLQHTATHCNTLQHTATHCNACNMSMSSSGKPTAVKTLGTQVLQHTATHCNALQLTATHRDTLRHPTTYCNWLQHATTHCNTLFSITLEITLLEILSPLEKNSTVFGATPCRKNGFSIRLLYREAKTHRMPQVAGHSLRRSH